MRPPRPFLVLLAVALLGAPGCGRESPGPSVRRDVAAGSLPGVVVLCIDTLRADVVSLHPDVPGYMPSLSAFARTATSFEGASAPSSWTGPSISSLLTGLLPSKHGLRGMEDAMPASVETLAERLEAAGWTTTAITGGGVVAPATGMLQGFASSRTDFDTVPPKVLVEQWGAARDKTKPFFLFLHTFAAHDPYEGKAAFAEGTRTRPDTAVATAKDIAAHVAAGLGPLPPDLRDAMLRAHLCDAQTHFAVLELLGDQRYESVWSQSPFWLAEGWRDSPDGGRSLAADLREAYLGGLSYADGIVRETLEALSALRLPEGTVVAVVGDHGESFGEAGALYHGQALDESALRVPMIVRAPGRLPEGVVFRGSCSLLDFVPSVLGWANLPPGAGLDGVTLDRLVSTGVGRAVVAEVDPAGPRDLRPPSLVSVRTEAAKWILEYERATSTLVRERVYDLAADPLERNPLAPDRTGQFGRSFCEAVEAARSRIQGHPAAGGPGACPE